MSMFDRIQSRCNLMLEQHLKSFPPSIGYYTVIRRHIKKISHSKGYGMFSLVETSTSLLLFEVVADEANVIATYSLPSSIVERTQLIETIKTTFDALLMANDK